MVCRQVKIWFQNRRSKIKKKNKQPDADSSSSSSYVLSGSKSGAGASSTPTEQTGARSYPDDDDDDDVVVQRMLPPDSSMVYRRHEPQPASVAPAGNRERVASEPEASNVRPTEPMHLMTSYDQQRRHHDLLPAQQLVLPSLQLLTNFHPAAVAAGQWPGDINVPPPSRDVVHQLPINYEIDAGESSSYVPWYSHHLMDSYNQR